ncbi:MAG TPA: phosphatase PAP2 family protein [Steroidobacteraceae bacterium]|jgi:membrane-associated PAP2 superfamily phosphatase
MTVSGDVLRLNSVSAPGATSPLAFWWHGMRRPLAAFLLLATVFAITPLDTAIARALFFDSVQMRWIGADSWWTNEFIHSGGQWLVRSLAIAALVLWGATFAKPRLIELRRPAAYFIVAVLLAVAIVGSLKLVTNVHCPWALTQFGGTQPYIQLFSHRPASLRVGHCFPAAHAGSGYALIAFYFVFRERSRWLATGGIILTLVMGLVFGIAQQSRGAHFVSHDIWSAFLVWTTSLTVYTLAFKRSLWSGLGQRNEGGASQLAPSLTAE